MYWEPEQFFHLTYCTNIHPGNGWEAVKANLQRYALELKQQIAPDSEFGVGLRLSGRESEELLQGNQLEQLKEFLREQGLYIFTLNGFPYGPFHEQAVKAQVHAPDWREEERVAYTLRLIEILAVLLPEGVEGSISTSPLSYKIWVDERDPQIWRLFTRNMVRVAEALVRVRYATDKRIVLAIEPEPDALLQNSEELVRFYTDWLLQEGAFMLACSLSIAVELARQYLLEHIGVCLDTCHMAVAYEKPADVLASFDRYGIKVGKVQISSALKVVFPHEEGLIVPSGVCAALERTLQPFVEATYLHQVVRLNYDNTLHHYADLSEALQTIQDQRSEQWRIHFHVPIFMDHYANDGIQLFSTQDTLIATLNLLKKKRFCRHLEIETYTWSVLPEAFKKDIVDSIVREYEWVLKQQL